MIVGARLKGTSDRNLSAAWHAGAFTGQAMAGKLKQLSEYLTPAKQAGERKVLDLFRKLQAKSDGK